MSSKQLGLSISSVRVVLPHHLRKLAGIGQEVTVDAGPTATVASVLGALEAAHPVLRGTIRDHDTHVRRAFVRFFAAGEDISLDSPDLPLPDSIATGREPLLVVGAIAGG